MLRCKGCGDVIHEDDVRHILVPMDDDAYGAGPSFNRREVCPSCSSTKLVQMFDEDEEEDEDADDDIE